MRSPTGRKVATGIWYGALLLGGAILIWRSSPWGIGVRYDSLTYLTAAQSLGDGLCLCWMGSGLVLKPMTHFGPLYPVMLWAATLLSGDVLASARWLASVLFGANLAVWGGLVHLHTRRFWAGAVVSGLLALSFVMLTVHDAAMSEPLFLVFLALALMVLTDYLARSRRRSLWLAAAAVSLAVLTRYAGGLIIPLGIAAVLLLGSTPWKTRLADGLRFGAGATLPVALWSVRNAVVAGTATNRVLGWHPVDLEDLRSFLRLVTAWFIGGRYSHWLEGAVLVGVLAVIAVFLWRQRPAGQRWSEPAPVLGLVLVGLAGSYPVYIAIAHSVFDASIPIDDRMFSPVFVALVALLGVVAALVSRQQRARWILLPLMAVMLVAFLPHMVGRFSGKYESMRQDGVLLAGRAWRESGSVAWVRSLPAEALLYSNQALALEFLTGRSVYAMPTRVDTVKNEARPEFDAQLTGMRADLKRPNSYLLVFNPLNPMAPEDLQGVYADGLRVLQITGDGFVMVEAGAGGPG